MKGKLADKQRVEHIVQSISDIELFIDGLDYGQYQQDYKLRLAVVKLFEIIGEAASHISSETKDKYPLVEWSILKSLRNILVHEYFGIDYEIVWKSIQNNLPLLKQQMLHILSMEFPSKT